MMLPFLESPRFNTGIRYGLMGGPTFSTDIVEMRSGIEERNVNWLDSKGHWELASDIYNKLEVEALASFFRQRKGQLGAFRYKDWSDWRVEKGQGVLLPVTGDTTVRQMARAYTWGGETVYRVITKPVPDTVTLYDGTGTAVISPIAIDFTTGRVTTSDASITWSGEFDVPARFDSDSFSVQFNAYRLEDGETLYTVTGLKIREVSA